MTGTITSVEPFRPVTTNCTPPEDLDPASAVSSDDPPVCTDMDQAPLGTVLIEADPASGTLDKIVFTVGPEAALFSSYTGLGEEELTQIDFADLSVGRRAEVGFSGQVAESYPGQATAESVTLLDPGS